MMVAQPLALFWFLRATHLSWLASVTLATLVAIAIGVAIYLVQTWTKEEQ